MDYFEKGLVFAKEYYAIHKVWDVTTKTMFKDFNLGMWWVSVRKSIAIGSLTDEKVTILKDTNIDFGIVPLYWNKWMEYYKDWVEKNDKSQPLEKELYNETYYIGKWYKRNKKLIEPKNSKAVTLNIGKNTTYSKWHYYFEVCKKIAVDNEYLQSFSMQELSKILTWYRSQKNCELKGTRKDEFDSFRYSNDAKVFYYRINSFYEKLKYDKKNEFYKNLDKNLIEKKKNSFSEAIINEWVMYKKYDAYKDSVIVAKEDADYFEVSIAISNLFSEEDFVEYINKNKKNLVMRARMDIEATQVRNKCEFGYKVKEPPCLENYSPALKEKYKLNKLVYGLSSHIVTVLFFKNE